MVRRRLVRKDRITKKGIALSTLAMLILAGLSLAFALIILLQSGLLTNLQTIIGVSLTTVESNIRGGIISLIGWIYGLIILVVGFMLLMSSMCRAFPVGTAICAAFMATIMIAAAIGLSMIQSSIPWVDFPNPTIELPRGGGTCGTGGVDPAVFEKELADRSVDCWKMFAENRYDPLSSKVPPNPRTCFVIDFNLNKAITFKDIETWMNTNKYPGSNDHYWQKVGSSIVLEDRKDDKWTKSIQKGRIFVKYGDHLFGWGDTVWGSADCSITQDFDSPGADRVYWCIDEMVTFSNCPSTAFNWG